MLSEKIQLKIDSADKRLNLFYGYEQNFVKHNIECLLCFGEVEVGYRSTCGTTDRTLKCFREFTKIIALLKKEGFEISEESVKHNNAYATNNGGFWNSIIFKLINYDKSK